MSFFEALSFTIAALALFVSGLTAYETFYAKFKCELFIRPRVVLTQIGNLPALVVACEIMNSGNCPGSIDDVVLAVKHRQYSTGSIDRYTFSPRLVRNSYSIFEDYEQTDFEPFQTIALTAKSRFSTHIVFMPANNSFTPSIGELTIQLFFKTSGSRQWKGSRNLEILGIDQESQQLWASSRSVMIETKGNYEDRDELMKNMFK